MRRQRVLISTILGIGMLGMMAALAVAIVPRAAKASPQTLTVCLAGSPTCQYGSINDALAAANPGDTISVAAGTYTPASETNATTTDAAITINKAITLQGAGVGQTILNVASAYTGTAASGAVIRVSNPGGDVTISGFTFEGANVQDSVHDGIFIYVHDTAGASDTITISHNLFYADTTIDPDLAYDQNDSIYVASTVATTTITDNTFQGVFRAALIERNPGPTNFTNNVLTGLGGLQDKSDASILYVAEGVFYMDHDVNVTTPQINENNLFENFGGLGIAVGAGYGPSLNGNGSNYTISHNTFNLNQVLGNTGSPFESPAIVVKSYNASSTITDTTISDNVFNLTSPTGDGYAVWLYGGLGSGISITHNALIGSDSGGTRPLAGININGSIASTNIAINNNLITGFQNGIFADSLTTGATVGGSQNCIYSNTTSGATNGRGETIAAANNWWGAASGPLNATSNPGGTGNAVSDNITFQPFLTKAAAACSGPVVTNLLLNPNPVATGQGYAITALATGGFNIASATYTVDGGSSHPMSASDGSFNSTSEALKASGASFAATGTHKICVTATDILGNVSAPACTSLTVMTQSGLDGLGNTPAPPPIKPPSGNGTHGSTSNGSTTTTTNPVANAQSGNAPLIKMAPSTAPSSLPGLPLAIFGGVLLLCGLGVVAVVITRKRLALGGRG